MTVRTIKEEIEKHYEMVADTLKLIAYGKVLDDDAKKASDYSIKEGDFIVAMVQKPKAAPKPKPSEEVKMEDTVPVTQPVSVPTAQPAQAQPAQAQPAQEEEALPAEVELAITELQAISGKDRDLCIRALAAAHNIPDIAFEFLISGHIPEMPIGGGEGEEGGEPYGDEEMGEEGENPLSQYNLDENTMQAIQTLVQNPSFPMIRQRMISDPNFS